MSSDQPQAFTCPYCGKMGFTDATLQEHVASDHVEASQEVVRFYTTYKQFIFKS